MLRFTERNGAIVCVDDMGEVQYEAAVPAVLFDAENYVLIKIGNYEDLSKYYMDAVTKAKAVGQSWLTDSWFLWELPGDAELMNNILDITGYLKHYLADKNFKGSDTSNVVN